MGISLLTLGLFGVWCTWHVLLPSVALHDMCVGEKQAIGKAVHEDQPYIVYVLDIYA